MLPKECLAHPWIARHRAKVNCDAILERPAEGPIMDNRQIMRYNAQRKLRVGSSFPRSSSLPCGLEFTVGRKLTRELVRSGAE